MKKTNSESKKIAKKALTIVGIVLGSLVIAVFLAGIISELVDPLNAFSIWAKENIWDVTTFPDAWKQHQKTVIHCVILIVVVFAVSSLLRLIFRKLMKKSNRAKTVITLLDGIIKSFVFLKYLSSYLSVASTVQEVLDTTSLKVSFFIQYLAIRAIS